MLCLGIEGTAHTFACSVINPSDYEKYPNILSDVRDSFKAADGSDIYPREASSSSCFSGNKGTETISRII